MDDAFWNWPSDTSQRVRYLCWRAVGASRDEAMRLSLRGLMPANWAMTQEV